MPFRFVHQDITKVKCDAIVAPTDSSFSGSGGTDRSIHMAAGIELDVVCRKLAPLGVGETAVTDGYALPCQYIIHTMGPVWQGGNENEEVLLRSCYLNCLLKAKSLDVQALAFPLISSGTFGFPKDKVLKIASDAISDFLFNIDSEMDVSVCVIDRSAYEMSRSVALRKYLDNRRDFFCEEKRISSFKHRFDFCDSDMDAVYASIEAPTASMPMEAAPKTKPSVFKPAIPSLSVWIKKQDKSFSEMLLELIQQKQMKEVECYKKANVSKNTFSKIKNAGKPVPYKPSKPTVIAFAIALELDMDETQQLLRSAGFSLSHNDLFDLIIEFYITNGIYDIFEINAALYQYDQVCLGC